MRRGSAPTVLFLLLFTTFTVTAIEAGRNAYSDSKVSTQAIAIALVEPNFTISVSPVSQTVAIGSKVTYSLLVTSTNNFAGDVALSLRNLPASLLLITGIDPTPVSLQANSTAISTLTIDATGAGEEGYSDFLVVGTSGSLSNQAHIEITVVVGGLQVTPASFLYMGSVLVFAAIVIIYGLRSRRAHRIVPSVSDQPRPPPV